MSDKYNLFFDECEKEITLKDLYNFEFKDWKENGKLLNLDNEEEINEFYNLVYSDELPPYYHCFPEYNTMVNDSSYKYIVVNHNNDKIFIAYKVIQIMNNKLIKVYDKPISLLKDDNLECEIANILVKKAFMKFSYKSDFKYIYGNGEICEYDCDYYLTRDDILNKCNSHYRKKNAFNRFENGSFKIEFTNNSNVKNVINLREIWGDTKMNIDKVSITPNLSKFKKIFNYFNNNSNFIQLNIYYKDTLYLNYVYLKYKNCLINLYRTTLSKTTEQQEDTWLNNTISRIDKYAVYSTFINNQNISTIYYAGTFPNDKYLKEHKLKHSTGRIEYLTIKGKEN